MARPRLLCAVALTACLALPAAAAESNEQLDAFRRRAQLRLAESALASHDIDAAQERLEQALELAEEAPEAPELSRVLELLGDVYLRRNQLRTAASFYSRAIDAWPSEASRILEKRGRVALRRGRYAEAASHFEDALAAADPTPPLYMRLAEARLRAGDMAAAAAAFEQAITAEPPDSLELAALHESIARRYLWLAHDSPAAGRHSERALEIRRAHETDSPAQLGRALRNRAATTAEEAQAEEWLAELARLRGPLPAPVSRQIRARRLLSSDQVEEAIAELAAAVETLRLTGTQPLELAAALESLAALEERRGGDAASIAFRREAFDLRRGAKKIATPIAVRAMSALASVVERDESPEAAEALLKDYISELGDVLGPKDAALSAANERLGDLMMRRQRVEEAAERFQNAVQIRERAWGETDARLQPLLERLSDALRRAGREEEARGAESQLALLTVIGGPTREPPQGRRDTGTWLSEPYGLAFLGLALAAASAGLVWLGWSTFTSFQPAFESRFRKPTPRLDAAPAWRPIARPQPRYAVTFRGRGAPLFGIWSVNMALTLVTLGFYFFWGKIRTRRYFWGQAELAGDRFAFRGTGGELLVGWMKAAPILALVLWGPGLLDLAWEDPNAGLYGAGIALALLGLLWPLAEVGANRYRLSRTSWRAIRFSFRGRPWPYMKIWLLGMPLWIVTLGLWGPFFNTARRRYLLEHMQFGDAKFTCDIHGKDLFSFYLVAWILFLPTAGTSYFWYKALAERYYWSRTQLAHNEDNSQAEFDCNLKGVDLLVLWIQTTAMLLVTLGLGWPWTRIWEARLRLQTVAMTGDFRPGRIRQSTAAAGAAGEGAADFLGLDFGFFA